MERELLDAGPQIPGGERLRFNRCAGVATPLVPQHGTSVAVAAILTACLLAAGMVAQCAMAADSVPSLQDIIDRNHQKSTVEDMKAIRDAMMTYMVDHAEFPSFSSVKELAAALEPGFIEKLPLKDGWGNDYLYLYFASADETEFGDYLVDQWPEGRQH